MNPVDLNNPEAVKTWNEAMIDKYNLVNYFDHPIYIIRLIENIRIKKIIAELQTDDVSDTLEVGCGAGQILLRVPQGRLHGFDLSGRMVELSRYKILQQFPERLGILITGDAEAWPNEIKEKKFTNIFCSEVLEHVPNPRRLMEELHQATDKTTRAVVISTPNEPLINKFKKILITLRIFKWLFPNISTDMTEEWHLSSFDIPLMQKMSQDLFSIKKIQGVPFNWLPLRYVFTLKKIQTPASEISIRSTKN